MEASAIGCDINGSIQQVFKPFDKRHQKDILTENHIRFWFEMQQITDWEQGCHIGMMRKKAKPFKK